MVCLGQWNASGWIELKGVYYGCAPRTPLYRLVNNAASKEKGSWDHQVRRWTEYHPAGPAQEGTEGCWSRGWSHRRLKQVKTLSFFPSIHQACVISVCRAIYVRMLARKKLQLTTEPVDKASIQPIFAVGSPTSSGHGGGVVSPRVDLARKPLTYSGTTTRGVKRPSAASLVRGSASPSVSPVLSKRQKTTDGMQSFHQGGTKKNQKNLGYYQRGLTREASTPHYCQYHSVHCLLLPWISGLCTRRPYPVLQNWCSIQC